MSSAARYRFGPAVGIARVVRGKRTGATQVRSTPQRDTASYGEPTSIARAIGIDLGTTPSAVVVIEGGEPTISSNAEGERIVNEPTASALAYGLDTPRSMYRANTA